MSATANSFPEEQSQTTDTVSQLSEEERVLLDAAIAIDANGFPCKICGYNCVTGEFTCDNCGAQLASRGKIHQGHSDEAAGKMVRKRSTRTILVKGPHTLAIKIGRQVLVFPRQGEIILGRLSTALDDPSPDVNLNAFGAEWLGVSRQHILITCWRDSVYVVDLGSYNGTYLNERGLAPNIRRVLHNGDELRLGHLKLRVAFEGIAR
jgi:hypothetical protein